MPYGMKELRSELWHSKALARARGFERKAMGGIASHLCLLMLAKEAVRHTFQQTLCATTRNQRWVLGQLQA